MAERIITGKNESEIWQQLKEDLEKEDQNLFDYTAVISHQRKRIVLNIDIDPGGGFESGYATTSFIASVARPDDFRFAIHPKTFLDDVGKFFGMEDVRIGYPKLDARMIIKTNDVKRIKKVFSEAKLRELFASLDDFTLSVTHEKSEKTDQPGTLQLVINQGITDAGMLRKVYHGFITVLQKLDGA